MWHWQRRRPPPRCSSCQSAEAGATTPAGFFGLNYYFKDITSGDVLYLKKSGAKTVRWRMNWSNIEPSSGHFDWSAADAVVGDLAAQGIRVLPVMWGSPGWVASSAITPPISTQEQRDAWSGYLRAAIKRYGPQGNYWTGAYRTQHPGKTPLPIDTWQIWNEANLRRAMNPPTPSTYAKLLTLSHTVIKQADPKAKVMFAGLLSHPNGATAWDFLRDVYQQPGARNAFDIMASNAYSLLRFAHARRPGPHTADDGRQWAGPEAALDHRGRLGLGPGRRDEGYAGPEEDLDPGLQRAVAKALTSGASGRCSGGTSATRLAPSPALRLLHLGGPPDQRL